MKSIPYCQNISFYPIAIGFLLELFRKLVHVSCNSRLLLNTTHAFLPSEERS